MSKGLVRGKGRAPTRFSFTYEDYAEILGCSIEAARKHAQRGNFDPSDLLSVLEFVRDRLSKDELNEDHEEKAGGPIRSERPVLGSIQGRDASSGVLQQAGEVGTGVREHDEERLSRLVDRAGERSASISRGRDRGGSGKRPGYSRGGDGF